MVLSRNTYRVWLPWIAVVAMGVGWTPTAARGDCGCRPQCHPSCKRGHAYDAPEPTDAADQILEDSPDIDLQLDEQSAAYAGDTFVTNMIGDFFGPGSFSVTTPLPSQPVQVVYADASVPVTPLNMSGQRGFVHPGGTVSGVSFPGITIPVTFAGSDYLLSPPAIDGNNDTNAATLPLTTTTSGLTSAVAALQSGPGTLQFVDGVAVLVSPRPASPGSQTVVLNGTARAEGAGPFDTESSGDVQYNYLFVPQPVVIAVGNPGAGGFVGRTRLSDNNSALPRDRVFFDYNYFHNVPLIAGGADVNRFVPGFEKTFFQARASLEMRLPMATTVDSTIISDGSARFSDPQFGDLTVIAKLLLSQTTQLAVAGGVAISVPTSEDMKIEMSDGTPLVTVDRQSVHIVPYLAALYTPNSNLFVHAFLQTDIDVNGNSVLANRDFTGLVPVGTWQDQTLLMADLGIGSWLYRDPQGQSGITGVAVTGELHYTNSVQDADSVTSGSFVVGNPYSDIDLLNASVGAHVRVGRSSHITAGYGFPLTAGDRVFDGELRAYWNRFF